MSRILKKSLAIVLALAICLSTVISGISVFGAGAVYTGSYKITFGAVSNDRVTATVAVTSTATDISAVLTTINLPGLPVTAISTDSVYELTTDCGDVFPVNGLTAVRLLVDAKSTGSCYNYANIYITFDVSSKALVQMGVDPNASTAINVSIDTIEVSSYAGGADGLESEVWIKVADGATTNAAGQAASTVSVKGNCSHAYSETIVTAATCNKEGLKRFTCSNCGYSYDEAIATTEHSWDNGAVTTAPTCTAGGVMTFTCASCSTTKTETVDSLGGHDYYAGEYDADPAHFQINAGSCLSEGTAQRLCTRCKAASSTTINIGYGAHAVSAYDVVSEPTCGAAGTQVGYCDLCFEEVTASYGEPTGNHTWDGGVETTPPTTTSTGVMTYTCTGCSTTYTADIPMLEEECEHTNLAAAAYEANTAGTYDAVIRCADCNEITTSVTTEIPAGTTVNSEISFAGFVFVDASFGFNYTLTKSHFSSYASHTMRIYRTATDGSYNLYDTAGGEISSFTAYGSKREIATYTGLALTELNLPVVAIACGYDASGNLSAVSAPVIYNPVDLMWGNYTSATTAEYKAVCVDLMNLASEAQLYFSSVAVQSGNETPGLATVGLPRDKYAFLQSDATQGDPALDLDTLPNSITNNGTYTSNINGTTKTHKLTQNAALASSPYLVYMLTNGKSLDISKLKMEVSYTSHSNSDTVSATVVGDAATDTTDAWTYFGTRVFYNFLACRLYDTDVAITATFTYDNEEMFTSVYSIDTFVAQNMANEAMGPALKAISKFGASARAHFGYV